MNKRNERFWEERNLNGLSDENWEALCDGCGHCCMVKFEDEDTGEILYTDVACRLFDGASCRCTDYPHRTQQIAGCLNIRNFEHSQYKWLPKTCAYRLLHEGKNLFDWHPLISGNTESVFRAGFSVRGKSVPEKAVPEDEMVDHIIDPEEKA
jgi:uncharacterized cysteine cluster protein YcgN (CxxCxxCC family)